MFSRTKKLFVTGGEWQEWRPGSHLRSHSCREIGTQAASACCAAEIAAVVSVHTGNWLQTLIILLLLLLGNDEVNNTGPGQICCISRQMFQRGLSRVPGCYESWQCNVHWLQLQAMAGSTLFLTSLALVNNANDWDSDSVCQCQNIFHTHSHSVQNCLRYTSDTLRDLVSNSETEYSRCVMIKRGAYWIKALATLRNSSWWYPWGSQKDLITKSPKIKPDDFLWAVYFIWWLWGLHFLDYF